MINRKYERDHKNGFLPSLELATKFYDLYEERQNREDPEGYKETIEMLEGLEEEFVRSTGIELPTEGEMEEIKRDILGDYVMDEIISYTNHKSYLSKGNCKGLVDKLTQDDSFNKEFLRGLSEDIYIEESKTEFCQSLHEEFVKYARENPEAFHYAKMKVNENDEIEFYDFKEEEFPKLDELTKRRWTVTE